MCPLLDELVMDAVGHERIVLDACVHPLMIAPPDVSELAVACLGPDGDTARVVDEFGALARGVERVGDAVVPLGGHGTDAACPCFQLEGGTALDERGRERGAERVVEEHRGRPFEWGERLVDPDGVFECGCCEEFCDVGINNHVGVEKEREAFVVAEPRDEVAAIGEFGQAGALDRERAQQERRDG